MSATATKYQLHVISHTHWDREWYLSHENFRLQLVDLIDHLIEIMESTPDFKYFHLDGQTIVLEDYLEIRPHMRSRLARLISEGRILIGPWYLQNDEYLTDGEATIRNLLIGHRMCRQDYEVEPMPVGYVPDQFGNISQLPQILRGFNIDTAVYGRGSEGPNKKPEFLWQSPDGSEVFAVHLFQWYNNAQRLPRDPAQSIAMCREIIEAQQNRSQTSHLCLMNGVDHLAPQENLAEILKETNEQSEEFDLIHSTLPTFLDCVRAEIRSPGLHIGEMREGDEGAVLAGTASARVHLKLANFNCQQTLRRWVEPFAVFARTAGSNYQSEDPINYAWKVLIQCHPHDSICGCSIDEVHFQMEARFRRVMDVMNNQLRRSFRYLTAAIGTGERPHHSVVNLFNAQPYPQSGVIEAVIDLRQGEGSLEDYRLIDSTGNEIPFSVQQADEVVLRILNPKRLPKVLTVMRHRILIDTPQVGGLGYRALTLIPAESKKRRTRKTRKVEVAQPSPQGDGMAAPGDVPTIRMTGSWEEASTPAGAAAEDTSSQGGRMPKAARRRKNPRYKGQQIESARVELQNEFLTARFRANGSFELSHGESGKVYSGVHLLEDIGDRGNEYIFMKPKNDSVRTSADVDAELEVTEDGPLRQQVRVTYTLKLPREVVDKTESRPGKLVDYVVQSTFSLSKGARHIEVVTRVNNTIKDHRLRVLFPTDLNVDHCFADAPFDMVRRANDLRQPGRNNTHPMESMVTVTDGKAGLAVFSAGAPEYEVLNENTTIALTLLRCVDILGDMPPEGIEKEQLIDDFTPGAQCLRDYEFQYGIYPYSGDVESGGSKSECERFLHPLRVFQLPSDRHAWLGHRPGAPKFFDYFEDEASMVPDPDVKLPSEMSLVEAQRGDVVMSALKFPEAASDAGAGAGNSVDGILRLVNYTESEQWTALSGSQLAGAQLMEMSEDALDEVPLDGEYEVRLPPKKVVTVGVKLRRMS